MALSILSLSTEFKSKSVLIIFSSSILDMMVTESKFSDVCCPSLRRGGFVFSGPLHPSLVASGFDFLHVQVPCGLVTQTRPQPSQDQQPTAQPRVRFFQAGRWTLWTAGIIPLEQGS